MLSAGRSAIACSLLAGACVMPACGATCSILAYHRFSPRAADSMTTTTLLFRQQILQLRHSGFQIVPLSRLVETLSARQRPPGNLVAITVDDGHRSVFDELLPAIQELDVPVTLFVYPSAIGRAGYALSWEQLHTMAADRHVEIGSHTYWHPDFRHERLRLNSADFSAFLASQLNRPKTILRARLDREIQYLAWPYGIADDQLQRQARRSGYAAAFALGNRNASVTDPLYALPLHMFVDAVGVQGLLRRLQRGPDCAP